MLKQSNNVAAYAGRQGYSFQLIPVGQAKHAQQPGNAGCVCDPRGQQRGRRAGSGHVGPACGCAKRPTKSHITEMAGYIELHPARLAEPGQQLNTHAQQPGAVQAGGAPLAGGGVEALGAQRDQVVGVDGLQEHRHLLQPLLQQRAAARAARASARLGPQMNRAIPYT